MSSRYQTISLDAPSAKDVSIAGTFSDWKLLPMARGRDADWVIEVWLSPGRNEFKFLVDGHWCCDDGPEGPLDSTEGCVHNAFGTMNRVIDVTASTGPEARTTMEASAARLSNAHL